MQVLGVVPARGGSKGVPRKNVRLVAGRPLLAYTADSVRASRRLHRTVLSTDDGAVADAGRELGLEVPFLRPPDLGADDTPMLPVLRHAAEEMRGRGFAADVMVLLQPTSPLRRGEHIDAAVDLLERTGADSVVSVVEVPHQFNPASVMELQGDRLRPYGGGATSVHRQAKVPVYARNGPAVLALRVAVLARESLYEGDCRALVMAARDSIDVDTEWDLELAELVLSHRD